MQYTKTDIQGKDGGEASLTETQSCAQTMKEQEYRDSSVLTIDQVISGRGRERSRVEGGALRSVQEHKAQTEATTMGSVRSSRSKRRGEDHQACHDSERPRIKRTRSDV